MRESWGNVCLVGNLNATSKNRSISRRGQSRAGLSRCVTLPRERVPAVPRQVMGLAHDRRQAPGRNACRSMKAPRTGRTSADAASRSDRRRWKWVKVCRTSRPGSCHRRLDGGAGAGSPSVQSLPGQPSIPPSKARGRARLQEEGAIAAPHEIGDRRGAPAWPFSGPWRAARPRCPVAAPRSLPSAGRCRRRGISACRSSRRGPSAPAHGSRGGPQGVRRAASAFSSGLDPGSGSVTAKRRDMTRSILPSRTGAGRSKAMEAMAAAV
jgi:hypothetical protein